MFYARYAHYYEVPMSIRDYAQESYTVRRHAPREI